jgi:multidrug efflux pump subunit AcrA (membrane-fusion protein)
VEGPAPVRTAIIGTGDLEQILRLTGVTAAGSFASLIGHQLRGSRSRSGRSYSRDSSYAASDTTGGTADTGSIVAAPLPSAGVLEKATQRSASTSASSGTVPTITPSGFSGLGSTASSLPPSSPSTGGGTPTDSSGDYLLVLHRLVKPGSHVKKGEVVAEFDRESMMNRLDDFKAVVVQSEISHQTLGTQLEVYEKAHARKVESAKADLDKALLDLKTTPVRSDVDAQFLKLAADEADATHQQLVREAGYVEVSFKAQLRRSEIEVLEQNIELRRSQANADKMLVRAPMDGDTVMQSIYKNGDFAQVEQGDMLYPGMNFMRIVDPNSMVVNAVMNQLDSERLRIGQRATVRFDAYPDLVLPARVHAIGAMTKSGGFRASFVKEIPVVLKLEKLDPRVTADLSVSAEVVLASEQNAALAPLASVFADSSGGRPFVFVKQAAGWERREVELGLRNNLAVAVRSGVEKGAVVAVEWPKDGHQSSVVSRQ